MTTGVQYIDRLARAYPISHNISERGPIRLNLLHGKTCHIAKFSFGTLAIQVPSVECRRLLQQI